MLNDREEIWVKKQVMEEVISAAKPVKSYEMHVAGPDDIIIFSDELEALRRANEVNKEYLADRAANPQNEVLCVATVHEVGR